MADCKTKCSDTFCCQENEVCNPSGVDQYGKARWTCLPKSDEDEGGKGYGQGGTPTKITILGRTRNIVVQGRAQYCRYQGELVRLSELRKMEKSDKKKAQLKKRTSTKKKY